MAEETNEKTNEVKGIPPEHWFVNAGRTESALRYEFHAPSYARKDQPGKPTDKSATVLKERLQPGIELVIRPKEAQVDAHGRPVLLESGKPSFRTTAYVATIEELFRVGNTGYLEVRFGRFQKTVIEQLRKAVQSPFHVDVENEQVFVKPNVAALSVTKRSLALAMLHYKVRSVQDLPTIEPPLGQYVKEPDFTPKPGAANLLSLNEFDFDEVIPQMETPVLEGLELHNVVDSTDPEKGTVEQTGEAASSAKLDEATASGSRKGRKPPTPADVAATLSLDGVGKDAPAGVDVADQGMSVAAG